MEPSGSLREPQGSLRERKMSRGRAERRAANQKERRDDRFFARDYPGRDS